MSYPDAPRFLIVLDADSTLLRDEVIELLADEAGSRERVAEITERAMNGMLDFSESLRLRVATLRGTPESAFARVAERVRVTDGADALIEGVHSVGGRVGVVSGGFHEILDPLLTALGLDCWRANRLESRAGELTGSVAGRIVDAAGKAESLIEWGEAFGIAPAQTIAIGDGANDLLMMEKAGLSVAFNAKQVVRDAADVIIDRADLSQVLPLLGLRG